VIIKWMAITFGIGMALLVFEWHVARKKKEGFTVTDRQRCTGIFWLSIFASLLVGGLMFLAELAG
jgi:hypothetical protein